MRVATFARGQSSPFLPTIVSNTHPDEEHPDVLNHPGWECLPPDIRAAPWEDQIARLTTAQKVQALTVIHCLLGFTDRAHLVEAPAGTGKTFVAGQIMKWLSRMDYERKQNFFGPYPRLYLTFSGVVTQTQRVMNRQFNLRTPNDVIVIGKDALRSKWGKQFIKYEKRIVQGDPVDYWEWIPFITPATILIDESHAMKNENSKQSRIMQALARIGGIDYIKTVWMSATPFARVCETKAFILNCKIDSSELKNMR